MSRRLWHWRRWPSGFRATPLCPLHSQGAEIYWNYRGYEPPESKQWAAKLAAASGYRAVELTGSDAGYKDWFIQRFRKPGFTVELGAGKNPLPAADFEDMALETGLILGGNTLQCANTIMHTKKSFFISGGGVPPAFEGRFLSCTVRLPQR
ncbi:hypothetical protein ACFSQ7_34385 [Paenibacillus rhizoplanae]